jgi:hypothetical protein
MTEERTRAQTITLYPADWEDIATVASQSGVRGTSAALRIIIQEWRIIRAQSYHLQKREGSQS